MKVDVFNISAKKVGTMELSDAVFAQEYNEPLVHQVVVAQMANKRQGNKSTLTRSEVRGGGIKPWRQKGTGHARQGSTRAPQWRHGGVVHAPKPRDYSYSLPKKVKRLAMKSLLTLGVQEGRLTVVEDFTSENGKTKDVVAILKAFGVDKERTLIVIGGNDSMLRRAARNIPFVHVQAFDKLSAKELLYGRKILVLKGAASNLNSFYGER